jgi:CheY-like chemotaxis protein
MNLIINASEAIGEKSGVVTVSTGVMEADRSYLTETYLDENLPEGYYVSLEVADTGCGMDEQTRRKIFDPFFTTKFTGRGLGLAAVLGIVRGHGGALKVYSQPGRGTTFKILLPASQQPAEKSVGTSATKQEWAGSGVILVVDDEENVRITAKRMLEIGGFTVLTAEDGRKALEVFRSRADEIGAVLLDLSMPHLGGEETFRELRRIRPDVRVILSSGYNEEQTTNRFAGKGLAGFVQKPYGVGTLVERIRQALEAPPESDAAGTSSE